MLKSPVISPIQVVSFVAKLRETYAFLNSSIVFGITFYDPLEANFFSKFLGMSQIEYIF